MSEVLFLKEVTPGHTVTIHKHWYGYLGRVTPARKGGWYYSLHFEDVRYWADNEINVLHLEAYGDDPSHELG